MSESGYTEIDLNATGNTESDIEIVDAGDEEAEQQVETSTTTTPATNIKTTQAADEDEDDDSDSGEDQPRKRLTRTQRLKAQRDAFAQQLAELKQKNEEAETKLKRYEADAQEGAGVALDIYLKSIDDGLAAARAEFERAFDNGDRDSLWKAQIRVAELSAEKKQAEAERRKIPQKGASGGEAQQPTPTTTDRPRQQTGGSPSPAAVEWHSRNKWFGQDVIMTTTARVIDQMMIGEGFDVSDPDYFEELDKRLRAELPHKFRDAAPAAPGSKSPVLNQKTTPAPTGNKIRVTLTAEDKRLAAQMNIPLERYARQKYLRERAEATNNGYVEVL